VPREFVIVSPEPITIIECVAAANAVNPDLGLGRLWNGGGLQIAGAGPVLAVLRSSAIEESGEVERLLGSIPAGLFYLTEAYGPWGEAFTCPLAERLARAAGGTLTERRTTL
jgi:hypothetical protein